ncbi:hypothetical protein ACFWPP_03200 [Streptomyces anulatus]|uniref:hypothetical protein n=1 Tax=Streptomyces anulatus TaxID=1892 RepID=UPI00364CF2CA
MDREQNTARLTTCRARLLVEKSCACALSGSVLPLTARSTMTRALRLLCRYAMTPDQIARWRRLVDGLASAGDHRAADLQRMEE